MSLKLDTISIADKCCCLCRFYFGVLRIMILGQRFVFCFFSWERPSRCMLSNLWNMLCIVNTQHISRQDAIITVRLYLATFFGRKRSSSGQLRTILRYSKNSTQWDPILLYLNIVLNWPEDGRLRAKHAAKYNLIVIIASGLDVCCVLTVHNVSYSNLLFSSGRWTDR